MKRMLVTLIFTCFALQAHAAPFRLLLESNENRQGGSEVYLANFDDFPTLQSGTLGSGSGFSQLDIGNNFSAGGLAYEMLDPEPEVEPVPEPGSLGLLGAGLFGLIAANRRRFLRGG